MADAKKLARELVNLDDADWFAVLHEAKARRREAYERRAEAYAEPKPGISARQFARWIAQRHLATDPSIRDVIYLPGNSPPDEIRLLEVNVLLDAPEAEKAEFVDFSPGIEGIPFRVLVADVTPEQWEKIKKGRPLLPNGWALRGNQILCREKPA